MTKKLKTVGIERKDKTGRVTVKEYAEVSTRVNYFRYSDQYAGWEIKTKMINETEDSVTFRAQIKDANGRTVATGHAHEKVSSSHINRTSHIENCETSAVGRALGFLGIGSDGAIASAEEIERAQEQQKQYLLDEYMKMYNQLLDEKGEKEAKPLHPDNWKKLNPDIEADIKVAIGRLSAKIKTSAKTDAALNGLKG